MMVARRLAWDAWWRRPAWADPALWRQAVEEVAATTGEWIPRPSWDLGADIPPPPETGSAVLLPTS